MNGENEKRKNKRFEDINKFALGLLIVGIILFIISFVPYLICHITDILEKDGTWYTILWLVGTFLGPVGMIISAAILLVWAFIDGHILILFCFRKWVYFIAFPVLLAGIVCLCLFVPAWIWAVLFAPLGFCMVVAFLGCFGRFRTERVDSHGKILTLKRLRKTEEKQGESDLNNQDQIYEEKISEIEAKSIEEQKRHNLEMERIAKQKLQLEKQRAKEEKNKIDFTKCLTCSKKKTCGRVTCHFMPEK